MHALHRISIQPRLLIPWDGQTPIDRVLAFGHGIGGGQAHIDLLPLTTEAALHPPVTPDGMVSILPLHRTISPANCIIEVATDQRATLIVMATPCNPTGAFNPACLAAEIALASPIPVMLVHFDEHDLAAFPPAVRRLLVPLDGSLRAAQAIPFAERLARRLGLAVRLVTVIDLGRALPPAYVYDAEATAMMSAELRGEANWILRQAERMVGRNGVPVTSEILYGEVAPTLEAARQPGDVIVMTTHGIGGATRERLGSVAAKLVGHSAAPLIVTRSSLPKEIVVPTHGDLIRTQQVLQPTM